MPDKKLVRFDWAMKYILRNKANFDVVEAFLSNLLKEEIKVLDILESESNQDADSGKFNHVDLKCKDSEGKQIIIEIQNQWEGDYLQRLLWGTSKAEVKDLRFGSRYSEVVKVISISILYYTMSIDEKENTDFIYYGTTELVGLHTKKPLVLHEELVNGGKGEAVTIRNVIPEYYMIYAEGFQDVINEDIDEWVYFFKHGEIRDDFKSPGILLAARKLDYLLMSEEEKCSYERYLAYLGHGSDILDSAKIEEKIEEDKRLIKKGFTIENIAEIVDATGLVAETVCEILGWFND
ncbi:MAG TPA: PD-(D/E)XK nuclease family transposase [Clostridia bacterium]